MISRAISPCSVLAKAAVGAANRFSRLALPDGKRNVGRLIAVAVAAAGVGVSTELHAALSSPAPTAAARGVLAQSPDFNSFAQLSENGDGTAFTAVFTPVGANGILGTLVFDNTSFAVSTAVPPGQAGNGSASGVGHFTLDGYVTDLVTWEVTGPFDVSVDLSVTDPTTVAASSSQGVVAETNPFTGETVIVRKHTIGKQAYGDFAGSLAIRVDGQLLVDTTGGWGMVSADTVHSVQRIH